MYLFYKEVSFSVQHTTLYLALQPCIAMMRSFIQIMRALPHLHSCFVFAKQSRLRTQYMNRVLIHYCNVKKTHYLSLHLSFSTLIYSNSLTWSNVLGFTRPASHRTFPRTATFLFLNFSPLPPNLPITQLETVSLENQRARFCHWVS